MSTFWRRVLLIVGLIALGGGCNPLLFPFLYDRKGATAPAEMQKLSTDDSKKKEPKVVILTYMAPQTSAEFSHADREIAAGLARKIQERTKEMEEYISIVNPLKVEEYKSAHPDWETNHIDLETVGKHFKADYVIYLEIAELSMNRPGGLSSFYRAKADLTVTLRNLKNPDDIGTAPRQIVFPFPTETELGNQFVEASDTPPSKFRQNFLDALVNRVSWCFTERPTDQGGMRNK